MVNVGVESEVCVQGYKWCRSIMSGLVKRKDSEDMVESKWLCVSDSEDDPVTDSDGEYEDFSGCWNMEEIEKNGICSVCGCIK